MRVKKPKPLTIRPLVFLLTTVLITACGQTQEKPPEASRAKQNPLNNTIKLRQVNPQYPNDPEGIIVEKNFLNIVVSNTQLQVNGVDIKDPGSLTKLLSKAQNPVIVISSHKCLSAPKAAEILSIAQQSTQLPIAFSSYGKYDDPDCK